ncbi:hypothetical protein BJX63DRAFT_419546 [Aspergillus granulosus]|uniref:N-acetyltransferase domain-containing protein n=1 Tax=Aspergillus granulosus TaxID=176169 RepID=A0ABR4HQ35_9EURO
MTAPKLPCSNCRSNKAKPKCGRCKARGLECVPVERKAVFRHGARGIPRVGDWEVRNQTWVNSEPRTWQKLETATSGLRNESPGRHADSVAQYIPPRSIRQEDKSPQNGYMFNPLDALVSAATGFQGSLEASDERQNYTSPRATGGESIEPLNNIEESCLLRYFIEELLPWFDHCDDRSHFGLVVPLRAQSCLTVRNAIFAVSSRHLSCKLLSDLTASSAVEYMIKCIPGLLTFHDIQDPEKQDNLMAAAIILRQYEEMEEEMEEGEADSLAHGNGSECRVNSLAITQTIIYSMISSPLHRSSLATAAYWIAIRQEAYYALTRKRAPCITFTREDWNNAKMANMMIMHAGEVTKWCWGEQSVHEYDRLKHQQQSLIPDYSTHFIPILQVPADNSKGEIFPTVWYATNSQVTGVQHLELTRMIMTAENPTLRNPTTPRSTHRKAESQVRSIVLNLCGITVNNSTHRIPALVNAVIAIMLYGEYFTDLREREALVEIIELTKDMHAWPLKRPFERLRGQWGVLYEVDTKYKALRLYSLTTDPDAFSSTLSRETSFTDEIWTRRLLNPLSTSLIALSSEPSDLHDEISARSNLPALSGREWVGQVTLLGPVVLPNGTREEITEVVTPERPWEVFHGLDFVKAAKAVPAIQRGSRVVYLLAGMYVRPEARGVGYGKILVERALASVQGACSVSGWDAAVVVMVSRGNEGAKRLYERVGFVVREETANFSGKEEYVLELKYERLEEVN